MGRSAQRPCICTQYIPSGGARSSAACCDAGPAPPLAIGRPEKQSADVFRTVDIASCHRRRRKHTKKTRKGRNPTWKIHFRRRFTRARAYQDLRTLSLPCHTAERVVGDLSSTLYTALSRTGAPPAPHPPHGAHSRALKYFSSLHGAEHAAMWPEAPPRHRQGPPCTETSQGVDKGLTLVHC